MTTATSAAPPLASPLATQANGSQSANANARPMRGGCWLINVTPVGQGPQTYDGTLRVDRLPSGCVVSGDLYQRRLLAVGSPPQPVAAPPPWPSGRVPAFPIAAYVQYLRVTALDDLSDPSAVRLAFEAWRYVKGSGWVNRGVLTGRFAWIAAPPSFPSALDYLEGDVMRADGSITARMALGWLCPELRRVTVEVDCAPGCEQPIDNGAGFGWQRLFDELNWQGDVSLSSRDIAEPAGGIWSDAALHAAMLARRDRNNLDAEWRYHVLSVSHIQSADRGLMYDSAGTDSDNAPREGCAIAAGWPIPNAPPWGRAAGQRFGTVASAFFRAAVHELGHAFGLDHCADDLGFMNTTEVIAGAATQGRPFPANIRWAFSPADVMRLRHRPDILVRPGGAPLDFGFAGNAPPVLSDMTIDIAGLRLEVAPLIGELPIGAPVRIGLALVNDSDQVHHVPARISLKTRFVSGTVADPGGTKRRFRTLIGCGEEQSLRAIRPGERLAYDLTLLRGPDGALFPAPGLYRIEVMVRWPVPPAHACVAGVTSLFVVGAQSPSHAAAAHRVLATPNLHLVLVLGGDHLEDGLSALHAALADPVLAPHYAAIEARRRSLLSSFEPPTLEANAIMSASEAAKLGLLGINRTSRRRARKRRPSTS